MISHWIGICSPTHRTAASSRWCAISTSSIGRRRRLHKLDCEPAGFEWIDGGNAAQSILSYARHGGPEDAPVVVVCNFTPVVRHGFRIGVPKGGRWIERLNTDAAAYGGSNVGNLGGVEAQEKSEHGRPFSIELTLPPLATLVLEHSGD